MKSYGKKQHRSFFLHDFNDVIKDITQLNETIETAREKLIKCGYPKEEADKLYFMKPPQDEDDPMWEKYEPSLQKIE